jgi:GAF domain-containing protein
MLDRLAEGLRLCVDIPSILHSTLDTCLALAGTNHGNIQLVDWTNGHLKIAAQRGFSSTFLEFFAQVRAGDRSACGQALRAREVIIIEDVESDSAFSPSSRSIVLGEGVRAVQSIPLISTSGAFVGMLSTHFAAVRHPADDELNVMKTVAQAAANAVIAQRARRPDLCESSLALIASSRALLNRLAQREARGCWPGNRIKAFTSRTEG